MVHPTAKTTVAEMKSLLHFGKWVMLLSIVRPVMLMADRLMIGVQLGAIAVAAYVIPFQIATRLQLIPQSVLLVLFPRMASVSIEESRKNTVGYLVVFSNFFAPLIVGGICLAEPLLRLWLGSALDEQSILIARIILAGVWVSGMAGVANNFIMARGDSRYAALLRLIQLPFYLSGLYLAGQWYGLPGIGVAYVLLQIVDLALLAHHGKLAGFTLVWRTSASAVSVAVAVLLHNFLTGWPASLAAATLLCAITVANAYLCAPATYRKKLTGLIMERRKLH